jgi:hypothetical protein
MKTNKGLRLACSHCGLIAVMIIFPGCVFLDSPADTALMAPSASKQRVSYHQQSKQPETQTGIGQNQLELTEPNEETSLKRDPHPDWGPLNF